MDFFLGMIMPWPGGGNIPENWSECDGRTLTIQTHAALFSLLGTRYGGDGVNNFAIPDLRGRVVVGAGQSSWGNYTLAATGGAATATIGQDNIPGHTHALTQSTAASGSYQVSDGLARVPTCSGNRLGLGGGTGTSQVCMYNTAKAETAIASAAAPYTVTVSAAGAAQQIETRPPYLGLKYIMLTEVGIYPTRD